MTRRSTRRQLLSGLGAAGLFGTAGCMSDTDPGGDGSDSTTSPEDEQTTMTTTDEPGTAESTTDTPTPVPTTRAPTPTAAPSRFDGYLDDTKNYVGTVADARGQDSVTIRVGVRAGSATLGFGPPAVQIDSGTSVVWEWTGDGGAHTVTAQSGSFDSGSPVSQAGHTFEQTFDLTGVVKYYCKPHQSLGMKGVVVVGDLP